MTEHRSDDVQVTFVQLHTREQEREFERAGGETFAIVVGPDGSIEPRAYANFDGGCCSCCSTGLPVDDLETSDTHRVLTFGVQVVADPDLIARLRAAEDAAQKERQAVIEEQERRAEEQWELERYIRQAEFERSLNPIITRLRQRRDTTKKRRAEFLNTTHTKGSAGE